MSAGDRPRRTFSRGYCLAWRSALSSPQTPVRARTTTLPDLAVADEHQVVLPRQLAGLDHAVGRQHRGAGGDVQAGLDDAVVAEADADTAVRAEQAPFADRDLLLAAARQRAQDRRAAADVAAVADDHAGADAALDHRRAERAGVEVAEALVHHRGARGEVGAETDPRRVGDAHAGRGSRSRSSAGTCRRRAR